MKYSWRLLLFCFTLIHFYFVSNKYLQLFTEINIIAKKNIRDNPYSILVKDTHGDVILNKNVEKDWNAPLKFWNYRDELLMFIHVTKSGGQSFDKGLNNCKHSDHFKIKCQKNANLTYHKVFSQNMKELTAICKFHFDWSTINKIEKKGIKTAPIMLIRNPVKRFISHFHFFRTCKTTKNLLKVYTKNQNFSEYLNDMESLMESSHHWRDGQVCRHFGKFILTMFLCSKNIIKKL